MWEFIVAIWHLIRCCCHAIDNIEDAINQNETDADRNRTSSMTNQAPASYVLQLHNSQNNTFMFSYSEPDLRMLEKTITRDRSISSPPPLVIRRRALPGQILSEPGTPDSPQRLNGSNWFL